MLALHIDRVVPATAPLELRPNGAIQIYYYYYYYRWITNYMQNCREENRPPAQNT